MDSTVHSYIIDIDLNFERDDRLGYNLLCYMGSNYAGDLDKYRSITYYVFTNAKRSVSRRLTLQSTIALSTNEVEYIAITKAFKEAI